MKRIFFCLLLFNFQNLQGQVLKWYEGSLVLAAGNVITGKFAVEPTHDIVIFQRGDSRAVYPAHKIQSLYFYDNNSNINRRFLSIKNQDFAQTHYMLFEIVLHGDVTLLRRQKTKAFALSDALDFTYHVRYQEELLPLRKFGKKICPELLSIAGGRLADFISDNQLKANNDVNSIRIIEFYNRLIKSEEAIAKH